MYVIGSRLSIQISQKRGIMGENRGNNSMSFGVSAYVSCNVSCNWHNNKFYIGGGIPFSTLPSLYVPSSTSRIKFSRAKHYVIF